MLDRLPKIGEYVIRVTKDNPSFTINKLYKVIDHTGTSFCIFNDWGDKAYYSMASDFRWTIHPAKLFHKELFYGI